MAMKDDYIGERLEAKVITSWHSAEQTSNCGAQTIKACMRNLMQAFDIHGARSRNRTGTPLRAGDFKSHASTSFAIRAVARCS